MGQRGLINSLLSRTLLHNAVRALRQAWTHACADTHAHIHTNVVYLEHVITNTVLNAPKDLKFVTQNGL